MAGSYSNKHQQHNTSCNGSGWQHEKPAKFLLLNREQRTTLRTKGQSEISGYFTLSSIIFLIHVMFSYLLGGYSLTSAAQCVTSNTILWSQLSHSRNNISMMAVSGLKSSIFICKWDWKTLASAMSACRRTFEVVWSLSPSKSRIYSRRLRLHSSLVGNQASPLCFILLC